MRPSWQAGQVNLRVVVPLEQDANSTVGKDHDVAVGRSVWVDDPRVWPGFSVIVARTQHQEVSPFSGRI